METDEMSYADMYRPGGEPVPWDRASDEPPCEARYNGRFWSPEPCRKALDHQGFHADVYGRTWANPDVHLHPEPGTGAYRRCCGCRCPTGRTGVVNAVWMMSPSRWRMSHLIVTDGAGEDFCGAQYANAACGARVNLSRLEPEPTGLDTVDRCSGCRRGAYKYGADAES